MTKTSPAQFVREVRRELAKVTWPGKQEVTANTIMVIVLSIIAAIFFLGADTLMAKMINMILGLKG